MHLDIEATELRQQPISPHSAAPPIGASPVAPEKYELRELLGRGGCGVVYKARDRLLDRPVALKFLHDARPTDVERFRREARFAARLNDPAIVQIYEFGESLGQPYIAMQFVDGGSLADTQLPTHDVVRVLRDAAGALQRAHAAGIVHRDVKPGNVLLDRGGHAFLTDFGIARDLADSTASTLSRDGALIGTPALMAPEQARCDYRAIDARCDIYTLGASLYRLLCGRYPFERDNLVDLLHAVIHEQPAAPRSVNPAVPEALQAVILKCMQKEPAWRYASMAAVIADLDAFLEGRRPAGATPAPSGGGLSALLQRRAAQATQETFESAGMEIVREMAAWDAHLYRVTSNVPRLYPKLDSMILRLDDVLARHPQCAWARFYRGAALFRRGRLAEALDDMERTIDRLAHDAHAQFEMGRLYLAVFLHEQRQAHKHLSRAGTRYHMAGLGGRLAQAAICFREAQRLEHALLDWQIDFTDAVASLANGDYTECVARCDRMLDRDADLDDVWRLRGDALRLLGQDPIESYDHAIAVRRSDYQAHLGKAEVYLSRGDIGEARQCLRMALEIQPECAEAMIQLARSCLVELAAADRDSRDIHTQLTAEAVAQADRAAELFPQDYEAAVTRAQALTERARQSDDAHDIELALAALENAERLEGCQNRVAYLTARAILERARIRKRLGQDASEDLALVLGFQNEGGARAEDNGPWVELFAAARAERGS